jgi:hypothetical protein
VVRGGWGEKSSSAKLYNDYCIKQHTAGSMLGAVPEARTPQIQFRKGVIFQREELVVNGGSSFIRY